MVIPWGAISARRPMHGATRCASGEAQRICGQGPKRRLALRSLSGAEAEGELEVREGAGRPAAVPWTSGKDSIGGCGGVADAAWRKSGEGKGRGTERVVEGRAARAVPAGTCSGGSLKGYCARRGKSGIVGDNAESDMKGSRGSRGDCRVAAWGEGARTDGVLRTGATPAGRLSRRWQRWAAEDDAGAAAVAFGRLGLDVYARPCTLLRMGRKTDLSA